MSFMSDVKERLEKIPPWGYAAIAGGVLLLAFLTKNNSGGSTEENERTVYSVNPAGETYLNDVQWRMDDKISNLDSEYETKFDNLQTALDNRIGQIENSVEEGDSKLSDELKKIADSIAGLKNPPKTTTPAPSTPKPSNPAPAPSKPSNPSWFSALSKKSYSTPRGGWNSGSVVDYLKSKGYNADYSQRAKLAQAMGISNYTGTASQNVSMLNKLKSAGL